MVGPGDSEIWLNLTPFVFVGEVWIIFSVVVWKVGMFHRAFNTEAAPLSSTGHAALACYPALGRTARGPLDSSYLFHEQYS